VSVAAFFLASFGFFATVVFLPRWFQVVDGSSATVSGYQMLPLLGGLIFSAVTAGQIVSRTGRYRLLLFGALAVMAVGLFMLSQLRVDTPIPVLWAWMFVTGIGVGPTFAVFTIVVQNNVPVERIGTATSNLTFFQQVGGTVGLAITGTIFATSLADELPGQLTAAGVPPEVGGALAGAGGGGLDTLTGVGDLGTAILAAIPEGFRAQVGPFVPNIVDAIYAAFSIATANTFVIGIAASAVAAGLVLLLREAPAQAIDAAAEAEQSRATDRTPSAI
jgi:MFS family permease